MNEARIMLHSSVSFFSVPRACIPGIPVHGIRMLEMDGDGTGNAPGENSRRITNSLFFCVKVL